MTRIKICGMMNRSDLSHAVRAGADAVGFVVEIKESRHRLSTEEARDLIKKVPIFTKSVAVIAPKNLNEAIDLAKLTRADVLQVYGSLPISDLAELKASVPQKLIVGLPAGTSTDEIFKFANIADAILLDTKANGKLGGTGEVHDWNYSSKIAAILKVPLILAGGLNPNNVAEAIQIVRPYAVDASSGLETKGEKDPEKIRSFINEVTSCPH